MRRRLDVELVSRPCGSDGDHRDRRVGTAIAKPTFEDDGFRYRCTHPTLLYPGRFFCGTVVDYPAEKGYICGK